MRDTKPSTELKPLFQMHNIRASMPERPSLRISIYEANELSLIFPEWSFLARLLITVATGVPFPKEPTAIAGKVMQTLPVALPAPVLPGVTEVPKAGKRHMMDLSFQMILINYLRYLCPIATLLSPYMTCVSLWRGRGKFLSRFLRVGH